MARLASPLVYALSSAIRALLREPLPVLLATIALGLGVAGVTTSLAIWHSLAANPAGARGAQLYNVQVDNWAAGSPYVKDGEPPKQLTYRDATALYAAQRASRQVEMFVGALPVSPAGAPPFQAELRFTTFEFFAMFQPPFRFGGGWSQAEDQRAAHVVVLSRTMNRRLFDGQDSTGKTLRIADEDYRITGVLDDWQPVPLYYDVTTAPLADPEDFYAPFAVGIAHHLRSARNNDCWGPDAVDEYALGGKECVWINLWIEAATPRAADDYRGFLDDYARGQKALGRFPQPLNNRLLTVADWLRSRHLVDPAVRIQGLLSLAFLAICIVNAAALLTARMLARMPRIAVQRALGAGRRRIGLESAIEAGLIGLGGGLAGLALGDIGLGITRVLKPDYQHVATLDLEVSAMAVALSVASALLAAAWPAWRAVRLPPAGFLRAGA